jgi:hypothetical protein
MWRVAGGPVRSAVRSGPRGPWHSLGVPSGGSDAGDSLLPDAGFASAHVRLRADGSAVAVWAARRGGRWIVDGARRGRSGPWRRTPGFTLGPAVDANLAPLLGLGSAGDAAAVWLGPGPAANARPVRAARRLGTGRWGPTVALADAASDADLAVAADGRAIAAWGTYAFVGAAPATAAVSASGSGAWGAPEPLPAIGAPRVAINARGDLLTAWTEFAAGRSAVRASFRTAGSGWGPAATVGTSSPLGGNLRDAPVTLDDAGAGRIAWFDPSEFQPSTSATVSVATGRASGWRTPLVLGTGGSASLALAPGPAKTALLLMGTPGREDVAIFAVSDDPAPPVQVTATARGRWDARRRAVRWTVTVDNTGRLTARAVQLRIGVCCGSRLLESRPPATLEGRNAVWRLGTIRPTAWRTATALIRPGAPPPAPGSEVWINLSVKATAMPAASSQWRTVVPRG